MTNTINSLRNLDTAQFITSEMFTESDGLLTLSLNASLEIQFPTIEAFRLSQEYAAMRNTALRDVVAAASENYVAMTEHGEDSASDAVDGIQNFMDDQYKNTYGNTAAWKTCPFQSYGDLLIESYKFRLAMADEYFFQIEKREPESDDYLELHSPVQENPCFCDDAEYYQEFYANEQDDEGNDYDGPCSSCCLVGGSDSENAYAGNGWILADEARSSVRALIRNHSCTTCVSAGCSE